MFVMFVCCICLIFFNVDELAESLSYKDNMLKVAVGELHLFAAFVYLLF